MAYIPFREAPPSGRTASILEILNVCLWLKFSPSLALNKIEHFSKASLHKQNDEDKNKE
jgi:hypothetical protein